MTAEPLATAEPVRAETLSPVDAGERILTLDVLRGIALFGVLAANIWMWFSGVAFRFPEYRAEVWSFSPDSLAFLFIAFFISGKAISTFSLLFGIGFAMQMMRAEAHGRSIAAHHARRLLYLFVFGAVHAVLLWYGDILMAYALLGFGLFLFRKRSDRTVLIWSVAFIFVVPIALASVPVVMASLNPGAGPDPAVMLAEMSETNGGLLALFASADPAQIIRGNLRMLHVFWLSPKAAFLISVFGMFLLGLYVGRRRMFERPAEHRVLLRRILLFGFAIGLVATTLGMVMRSSIPPERAMELSWMPLALAVTEIGGTVPFALAYIATATLLLGRPDWRRRLSLFAPVGRMALTNYLAQTAICIAIYYPAGLVGRAGPLLGLVLAVVIFAAQLGISTWWLARFRYGPMEWLWRSLTYRRAQPLLLSRAAGTAASPTADNGFRPASSR